VGLYFRDGLYRLFIEDIGVRDVGVWNMFSEWSKVKGKLSLCFLTEHHAMEAYWEIGGIAPLIL
jgi:hypothetical protein